MGVRLRPILLPSLVAAVVAVVAVVLAGGSTSSTPSTSSSVSRSTSGSASSAVASGKKLVITIQNYAFHPAAVTVKGGTAVTVINRDQTQHTLTADSGAFDTGTIQPGQAKHLSLPRAGSFSYHCAFHAFMTGSIKVVS